MSQVSSSLDKGPIAAGVPTGGCGVRGEDSVGTDGVAERGAVAHFEAGRRQSRGS